MSRPSDHADEIERLASRAARDPRTHTFARLADLYRKVGELDQALEVIEAGLKHHPHYLNARLVYARLLRDMGRPEEAVAAFTRVLEIDSENRVARAALQELTGEPGSDGETEPEPIVTAPPPSVGWLARLDAEWRHDVTENGSEPAPEDEPPEPAAAHGAEATGGAAESADPSETADPPAAIEADAPAVAAASDESAVSDESEAVGESGAPEDESSADAELETGTLAALYVSQGLFHKAIAIYERLLARDPYNARLAAALEDARQRGRTGRSGRPPEPIAPPRPEPWPEVRSRTDAATDAVAASGADPAVVPGHGDPVGSNRPISDYLAALLEGRAPVDEPPEEDRRWPDWLKDIGVPE